LVHCVHNYILGHSIDIHSREKTCRHVPSVIGDFSRFNLISCICALLCVFTFLLPYCDVIRFSHKNDVRFVFTSSLMFLFAYSGVQHTFCCVFVLFIFILCTLCYQFLWIVHFWLPLRLVYPMLPVSLDCPFMITPSSCVPYVTSFSGLSILGCPLGI